MSTHSGEGVSSGGNSGLDLNPGNSTHICAALGKDLTSLSRNSIIYTVRTVTCISSTT